MHSTMPTYCKLIFVFKGRLSISSTLKKTFKTEIDKLVAAVDTDQYYFMVQDLDNGSCQASGTAIIFLNTSF
jgi:hypothetical protein